MQGRTRLVRCKALPPRTSEPCLLSGQRMRAEQSALYSLGLTWGPSPTRQTEQTMTTARVSRDRMVTRPCTRQPGRQQLGGPCAHAG